MNVKIEEKSLRFKIKENELKELVDGKSLIEKLIFIDNSLNIIINPHACAQNNHSSMEVSLSHEEDEVHLTLSVPSTRLQKLVDMGKSRKGIEANVGDILISLQVDIRINPRKGAKD